MSVTAKAVKSNKEEYLEEILRDIERRKLQHKKMLYRVNERLTDEVASYVKTYFENNDGYDLELTKCKRSHNVWDLLIIFL